MNAKRVVALSWMLPIAALIWSASGWTKFVQPAEITRTDISDVPIMLDAYPSEVLDRAARVVVVSNPFRISRRQAMVPFGTPTTPPAPAPPPPPKPALVLVGIVGGPPWSALIDGVPGREGSVLVSQGEQVSGLQIELVSRDSVVVVGLDTIWNLKLKSRWQ